ncbi:MAG: hypothetical protein RSD95_03915 [Clostridia bacterium]
MNPIAYLTAYLTNAWAGFRTMLDAGALDAAIMVALFAVGSVLGYFAGRDGANADAPDEKTEQIDTVNKEGTRIWNRH